MNEPIPTPFDITPIPYVAWEPSGYVFLLLFVALIIVALGIVLRNRRPGSRHARVVRQLLRDLDRTEVSASGIECERFSRLARRILSFLVGMDLSGYSADELRDLAAATDDSQEAEALSLIASIEDYAYAPAGATPKDSVRELARHIRTILSELPGSARHQ